MKPIQILLVEDNEGDIVLTCEALKEGRLYNEIIVARDGEEALQLLQNPRKLPDLILLDINLPRLNGLELLEAIKKDAGLNSIPVIMLTTSTAERDFIAASALNADCFISKPVDLNQFIEVVKTIEDFWITIVKKPLKQAA